MIIRYPCMYGVLTNVMVALFNLIAIKVNEFENHRTQSQYMNRLVLKVISFRFVAVFTTLYVIVLSCLVLSCLVLSQRI